MFARSVTIRLKPNCVAEFTQLIHKEAVPLLRKQKGFMDEATLVNPQGTEAVAISFWDNKQNAETYNHTAYPGLLKALAKVIEGTPQVHTFEVCNATFHKVASHVTA